MKYQNKNFSTRRPKSYFITPECYYIQDYLYSYLNNNLNYIEKKNLENHLKKCPSCCFEYESLMEFKKEIHNCISENDIQKLFQTNQNIYKFNKIKKLSEAFLTIVFVLILTSSITYLFLNFFNYKP